MPNFTPEQIEQFLEEFFNVVGRRQYIGARYVPIFGRKDESSIAWDNTKPYEPLTIVLYQGNSYTSRTYVPTGIAITDTTYWANTGNYNAQVEAYRQEVLSLAGQVQDVNNMIPSTEFDENNTVKDYIDDAKSGLDDKIDAIDNIIPSEEFDETNTVKDYIDDAKSELNDKIDDAKSELNDKIDATDNIIPSTDFGENNTVKDYIEALDFDNAYNRNIHATFANFTKVGQIPLGENEHCQGMTIDDSGNIYNVIGNNVSHVYKLRKHNSNFEYVNEVSLPTDAHGNCLDYHPKYGIFVFDSTGVILQYDTDLTLINTITTTGIAGRAGMHPGCGAVSKDEDMLHVVVTHSTSNRSILFMNNKNTLARYGEVDIGSTNSCYQQGGFGGENSFYQLFAAQDAFKHSFVTIYMYRGRKIRDVFLRGVGYEPQDITRYDNKIYLVNVGGDVFINDEPNKWGFSSSDTTNDIFSDNYIYNPAVYVVEEGHVQFTNASSNSINLSLPYRILFPTVVDGRYIDISYPMRMFGGKIGFLTSTQGVIRLVFPWNGINMVLFYNSVYAAPYACESKITAVETYINGNRSYQSIANVGELQTKLASIFAATYGYQLDAGAILTPFGENYINESVTGSTLVEVS